MAFFPKRSGLVRGVSYMRGHAYFPATFPDEPVNGYTAVAAGEAHSLALKSDGTVWAWGDNSYGQLGDGTLSSRLAPVAVIGLNDIVHISAGSAHSLAIKSDGTVWAWGDNSYSQLGDGTTTQRTSPVAVTVPP